MDQWAAGAARNVANRRRSGGLAEPIGSRVGARAVLASSGSRSVGPGRSIVLLLRCHVIMSWRPTWATRIQWTDNNNLTCIHDERQGGLYRNCN